MFPSSLTNSYLQYKADTNAVASWLATTAKKCGYASDLLEKENNSEKKPPGRLKGKARKQARAAANQSRDVPEKPGPPPTYTIAIKDFIGLAEYIVRYSQPSVSVPTSFVAVIERVISARRDHAAHLFQEVLPKKNDGDNRHSYFVTVLERVREILGLRMTPEHLGGSLTEPLANATENLQNKFNNIELYDPSEIFLQAPSITPAEADNKPEANYEAERLQDAEEAYFVFRLLLQDLNRLRTAISETWEGYHQGVLDLVATSVTTNSAIELARRMEEDLQATFEKHGGIATMLHVFYASKCRVNDEDPAYRERPRDDMNFRMYDTADAIFLPTYLILQAFNALVDPKHIPEYKPGFFGKYNPSSDRSKKTARKKFLEDKIVLLEILPEFFILCTGSLSVPAEDELIRGLRMMFKTSEIPLWAVFAAQAFLDIHHILRKDVGKGYADLLRSAKLISSSIKQNLQFHSSLRTKKWPKSNDLVLQDILKRMNDWVFEDPIRRAKERLKLNRRPVEPFRFMREHPLFCGLWSYSLKVLFHEVGIAFCEAWGSIMYAGHLYNAVRKEKLLERQWEDMELVMSLQDPETFFVGGPPETPEDYLKRFTLSMGYSVTAFAKDKRDGSLEPSKRGPKGLVEQAPVAQVFKDRYCHRSGRVELSLQDVEKIIASSNWVEEIERPDSDNKDDQDVTTLVLSRCTAVDEKRWRAQHQLSAVPLLRSLRNTLQGESLEMNFDYFLMHRFCWRLLRHVREHCDEDLRKIYGPDYLEKEDQLPLVVGQILMAATATERVGEVLSKTSDIVTNALLQSAADTIDGMIQSGAGSFVTRWLDEKHGIVVTMDDASADEERVRGERPQGSGQLI